MCWLYIHANYILSICYFIHVLYVVYVYLKVNSLSRQMQKDCNLEADSQLGKGNDIHISNNRL